jgi:ABC-type polysaccharide/polyol phosphate export permease
MGGMRPILDAGEQRMETSSYAQTQSNSFAAMLNEVAKAVRLWPVWFRLGTWDVRRRYTRTSLGIAWIFLHLTIQLAAVGFIYTILLGQNVETFIPILATGLIIWGYLTSSIVEGGNAFITSEGYIKQIGLPIYIYVFRAFVSITIVTLMSSLVYVVVAIVLRIPVDWGSLWALPGLVLLGVVSILLIFTFAHLNSRFRDIGQLALSGMQVLFYLTPVIWPADILKTRGLSIVYEVNPLYHLLEILRRPLLHAQRADLVDYAFVLGLVALLAGSAVLVSWRFHRKVIYFL